MTMAALTGGALFLPPIWLLFSKFQTGFTILTTSILTLSINGFFKFITPWLFDLKLDRAEEMLLGALAPVVILTVFELLLRARKQEAPMYQSYKKLEQEKLDAANAVPEQEHQSDNSKGIRVIGIGIASTGLLMLGLAAIAEKGNLVVGIMASIILILGATLILKNRKPTEALSSELVGEQPVK
jgi:hypothetical protein